MAHLYKVLDYEVNHLIELENECTQLMMDMWSLNVTRGRKSDKRVRQLVKEIPQQKLKIKLLEERITKEAL